MIEHEISSENKSTNELFSYKSPRRLTVFILTLRISLHMTEVMDSKFPNDVNRVVAVLEINAKALLRSLQDLDSGYAKSD